MNGQQPLDRKVRLGAESRLTGLQAARRTRMRYVSADSHCITDVWFRLLLCSHGGWQMVGSEALMHAAWRWCRAAWCCPC